MTTEQLDKLIEEAAEAGARDVCGGDTESAVRLVCDIVGVDQLKISVFFEMIIKDVYSDAAFDNDPNEPRKVDRTIFKAKATLLYKDLRSVCSFNG